MKKHTAPIKYLRTPALTVSLLYFSFGMAWINVSDLLVYTIAENPTAEQVTQFQTFKGFFFIGITALLLYILSIRYLNQIATIQSTNTQLGTELDGIYESVSDGVAKTDLTGAIIRSNKTFRDMTGLNTGSLISTPIKNSEPLIADSTIKDLTDGSINDHMGNAAGYFVCVNAVRDANYEPLYFIVTIR